MLPEFQRDFRWDLEQTHELFDSLIQDIFIGSIIYGKPSFAMTLRKIDDRKRKSGRDKKSSKNSEPEYLNEVQMRQKSDMGLRVILDGQQRVTSIYRALTGEGGDQVWVYFKPDVDPRTLSSQKLEDVYDRVAGEDNENYVCVRLEDAYNIEVKSYEDEDLNMIFSRTKFSNRVDIDSEELERARKIYRRAARLLLALFKQEKLVTFHLLDMSLEKFCAFFERSNSRGIQLNFTDVLAAKLYSGFNLRKEFKSLEAELGESVNRELMVRTVALLKRSSNNGTTSNRKIDKQALLNELEAHDFNVFWGVAAALYKKTRNYLQTQRLLVSSSLAPYENMLVPLMIFMHEVGDTSKVNQDQAEFLKWWYWSSIFSSRYSGTTNETILLDVEALKSIAKKQKLPPTYFSTFRSKLEEPSDLLTYTRPSGAIYRGILNLLHYSAPDGLLDWNSTQKVGTNDRLEEHHIFPSALLDQFDNKVLDQGLAKEYGDSVVNRALMPKLTNIKVGKRWPEDYLNELKESNRLLDKSLEAQHIPKELLNGMEFHSFLEARSRALFKLVKAFTSMRQDLVRELWSL